MAVQKHQKTKPLIIENGYADIDYIDIPAGNGYINWIENSKLHLKERECKLLNVITTKIETIVNKEINKMVINGGYFIITENIKNHTLQQLYGQIDEWNGINLESIISPIRGYKDYLFKAKNWWNMKKAKIFGRIFWLMVFKQIEKHINNRSMDYLNIIKVLFGGFIKYDNTKRKPLINGETIFYSSVLHEYLFNLHNILNIKQWFTENKLYGNDKQKIKILMDKLRYELNAITVNNTNYTIKSFYGCYHGATYSVSDTRYKPIEARSNNDNIFSKSLPQITL